MSYLHFIGTAVPSHMHLQEKVAEFFCNTLESADDATSRKINIISARSGIHKRYSVLEDFSLDFSQFRFFPRNRALRPLPGLNERMKIFKNEALPLSLAAVENIPGIASMRDRITHIITVTCTGLFAPGLDIELIEKLGLKNSTQRSSINFMGCNAAILALKQADQICRSNAGAMVLVVCTELCTIHFQKEYTEDYILSNLLFGDGSAAALISSEKTDSRDPHPIRIQDFYSLVIHEGYKDMAWQLSENGFIMNLTSYVSGILNKNIGVLLEQAGLDLNEVDRWAVHPGGKRILDEFAQMMQLKKEELETSYRVLQEFGNMSSATILFVLSQMMQEKRESGKKIFAAAFGPGLSIESVVLQYV